MRRFFNFIEKRFWLFFLAGILLAFLLPQFGVYFQAGILYFLGGILFLGYLTLDFQEVKNNLRQPTFLLYVIVLELFLIPIFLFFLTSYIYPALAVSVLLLTVMPPGMSTPAFTKIIGGNVSLSLVVVTATTLLVPFTAPWLLYNLTDVAVGLSVPSLMWTLIQVIFLPLLLAVLVRKLVPRMIERTSAYYGGLSIGLIVLIIVGSLSPHIDFFKENMLQLIWPLIFMFVFSVVLHLLGWYSIFWRNKIDRKTFAVSNAYLNFALALAIANQYFDAWVLAGVLLYELPWDFMLAPFRWLSARLDGHK